MCQVLKINFLTSAAQNRMSPMMHSAYTFSNYDAIDFQKHLLIRLLQCWDK